MRQTGVPRTDEERRAEHKAKYGTDELPPRGTGNPGNPTSNRTVETDIEQISHARREAVQYAANIETLRVNRWALINEYAQKVGGLNETEQTLDSPYFKQGWEYIINNISGVEEGTDTPQIKLGVMRGETFHYLTSQTVAAAEDSVDWSGQVIIRPGDRIRAIFLSATAAETALVFWSGYATKR